MELRLTQRHIIAANFLLIAGIAYFAARSVNDIISRGIASTPALPQSTSRAPRTVSGPHPRDYYESIVSRDIFNLVPQEKEAPEPVVTQIDLHIKLLGTSIATRDKPFAIIEDEGGEQQLYQLGEDIPNAGRLIQVEKDRVIIDHDSQQVALEIPQDDLPEGVEQAVPLPSKMTIRRPMLPRKAAVGVKGPPGTEDEDDGPDFDVEEEGDNRYAVKRDDLKNAISHSSQLFTQIRAIPNIQNGKQNGFSISDVEPGSVFEDLGLQDGDLLTAIDGKPITNPGEAVGLFSTIQNRPSVEITVMRDGHPLHLHYDIR